MGRSPHAPVPSWDSLGSGLGTHYSVHWGTRGSGESSLQHTGRREPALRGHARSLCFRKLSGRTLRSVASFSPLLYLHTGNLLLCLIYSRCHYLLIMSSSFFQDTGIWGTRSFVLFSNGLRDRAWLTVGTQCSTHLVV